MKISTGRKIFFLYFVILNTFDILIENVNGDWLTKCGKCKCKWNSGKKTADCKNISLVSIPNDLSSELQVLDLSYNHIISVNENAFVTADLQNLHKLFMRNCSLDRLKPLALRGLEILIELDLSGNLLRSLQKDLFISLVKVRSLILNGNQLETLEMSVFRNLKYLHKLELKNNRIVHMSNEVFINVPLLSQIYLNGNQLNFLRMETFEKLKRLASLSLDSNPWNCTCELHAFRRFVLKRNLYTPPTACYYPINLRGMLWTDEQPEAFACKPKIIYPSRGASINTSKENVTLICRVHASQNTLIAWDFNKQFHNSPNGFSSSTSSTSSSSSSTSAGSSSSSSSGSSSFVNTAIVNYPNRIHVQLLREENNSDKEFGFDIFISRLTIIGAEKSDEGTYTCLAENAGGKDEVQMSLLVQTQNQKDILIKNNLIIVICLMVLGLLSASIFLAMITCCIYKRFKAINHHHHHHHNHNHNGGNNETTQLNLHSHNNHHHHLKSNGLNNTSDAGYHHNHHQHHNQQNQSNDDKYAPLKSQPQKLQQNSQQQSSQLQMMSLDKGINDELFENEEKHSKIVTVLKDNDKFFHKENPNNDSHQTNSKPVSTNEIPLKAKRHIKFSENLTGDYQPDLLPLPYMSQSISLTNNITTTSTSTNTNSNTSAGGISGPYSQSIINQVGSYDSPYQSGKHNSHQITKHKTKLRTIKYPQGNKNDVIDDDDDNHDNDHYDDDNNEDDNNDDNDGNDDDSCEVSNKNTNMKINKIVKVTDKNDVDHNDDDDDDDDDLRYAKNLTKSKYNIGQSSEYLQSRFVELMTLPLPSSTRAISTLPIRNDSSQFMQDELLLRRHQKQKQLKQQQQTLQHQRKLSSSTQIYQNENEHQLHLLQQHSKYQHQNQNHHHHHHPSVFSSSEMHLHTTPPTPPPPLPPPPPPYYPETIIKNTFRRIYERNNDDSDDALHLPRYPIGIDMSNQNNSANFRNSIVTTSPSLNFLNNYDQRRELL